MISYLRRHWRGELSLAVSWWVNGLLVSCLIFALDHFGRTRGQRFEIDTVTRFSVFMIAGVTLLLVVPVWQIVGIYRAGERHIAGAGTILAGRLTQSAAVILALLLTLRLSMFALDNLPAIGMVYGIGNSACEVRVLAGGQAVELKGGISFGAADKLDRVLAANAGVRRIVLNSAGGSLTEAIKLRNIIQAHGLDTDSTTRCSSACVSAYIAGRHRYLHRGAALGFHLPRNPASGGRNPLTAEYRPEIMYFARLGVPAWFIHRWIATGHVFWYPAPLQLRQAGIVQTFVGEPADGTAGN